MEAIYKTRNLENYQQLSISLVSCITSRGTQFIVIPACFVFKTTTPGRAHANVLIYRKKESVLEHFEPHGDGFRGYEGETDFIKKEMVEFVKVFNAHLIKANIPEVRMVEPREVCPYRNGLQTLESSVPDKKYDIGGYCAAWSMFFTELALANPAMSSNEIIEVLMKQAGERNGGRQYMKDVIEGYADHISDKIDKYYSILFDKIMTTVEIKCRMDVATDADKGKMYDELGTIVNIEMDLFINNISISQKIAELNETKNKTRTITKQIEILKKMKILDNELTPEGLSFRSSIFSPLHQQNKIAKKKVTPKMNVTPPLKNVTLKNVLLKKKCPEGKHLNVITNRCNKDKTKKKLTPKKNVTPPLKNVTLKKCPEGQHLNVITNRCNKDKILVPKTCPEGKHLNVKTNRCNKDKK
jgi:hypothetical protein